ncbi:PorV/PorQ family protein [soil metagenome]
MGNKYFRIGLGLLLLLGIRWGAQAQATAPKYSNEFLNIGVGGRALGMGNVQSAIVRDETAGFWNPAGLLNLRDKYNIGLMHSELFAGIVKNDFATFAMPLDTSSALAISLIRTGVDNIADTRRLKNEFGYIQYDSIQFFSVADYALLLSYARKSNLIRGLQLGGSAKIIHRNVGMFANAWGFGVDLGAQLQRKNWSYGIMAKDITTTFTAWRHNPDEVKDVYQQTGNDIPENSIEITLPRLILGIGRSFQFTDKFSGLVATDLELTFDGQRNVLLGTDVISVDPRVGLELAYANAVYLRGGISHFQKIKDLGGGDYWDFQPNFGVGVAASGLRLDLALSRVAAGRAGTGAARDANLSSVIISLGYSFN